MKVMLKLAVDSLNELSFLESGYKSRAYSLASARLKEMTQDDFDNTWDFRYIPGVGDGINNKLIELKTDGTISKLIELRLANPNKLDPRLYKIRKSYITKRISLDHIVSIINSIEVLDHYDYQVAGSIRRCKDLNADIDVLIHESSYHALIKELKSFGYNLLVSGDEKSSFLVNETYGIQLDIISYNDNNYASMLLYLTGSTTTNIMMRAAAKELGMLLNQNGLYKDGVKISTPTEESIFEQLNIDYIEPSNR